MPKTDTQFKKGSKKPPNSGLKKGQKLKKTVMWEALGEYLVSEGATTALKYMKKLPEKEFLLTFSKMLEYFKPKMSSVQSNNSGEMTITITRKVLE